MIWTLYTTEMRRCNVPIMRSLITVIVVVIVSYEKVAAEVEALEGVCNMTRKLG